MGDGISIEFKILAGIAIIIAIVVAVVMILIKKSNISKKVLITTGIAVGIIAVGCFTAFSFSAINDFYSRAYKEDISIQLETQQAEIVIREWTYLLGSGAEIYYKKEGKEVMMGQLSGGDNGFCPFEAGQYSINVDGNKLIIEWSRFPQSSYDNKKIFDLPAN